MAGDQPVQQTTYQMVTLTPDLARETLKDESPQVLQDEIWQFLNTDLHTANLTEVDFLNIMDMVDIAFSNMLNGIPEDQWHEFKIQEIRWKKDGNGNIIPETVKEYSITELWDAVRAKVYIKCTGSRDGFLMKVLTENRSRIQQSYEGRDIQMPFQPQQKKSFWRP